MNWIEIRDEEPPMGEVVILWDKNIDLFTGFRNGEKSYSQYPYRECSKNNQKYNILKWCELPR